MWGFRGMGTHLKKVNCCPYIQGCRRSGGYFPKGGTMRLKSSAMQTNTAGSTIWEGAGGQGWVLPHRPPHHSPVPAPSPGLYLCEEPPGAASCMEHPLDEEGAELLASELPAPHPAAGLPGPPPQQVCLLGLLCCKGRDGAGAGSKSGSGKAGSKGQGLTPGSAQGGIVSAGTSPQPSRDGCCMQGHNRTPRAPSSYLAGVLGLSVKERKERLQPHQHLPTWVSTAPGQTWHPKLSQPPQTPVAAPTPALSPEEGAWIRSLGFHVPS